MLSTIEAINSAVNNFIWGVPAMICIIGVGLVLSFRTRFLQIRKFPYAMKVTFGRMFKKREASDGAMTPFQAVCTALAATVGTGNIAGVAGAIAIGGNEEEWQHLIVLTNIKWNGIITHLNTKYNLSGEEIQICCLYLAEIPVKHIGHFIKGYARSTVQLKAKNLLQKIKAPKGKLLKDVLLSLSQELKV